MTTGGTMIELKHISKNFGQYAALKDINFSVKQGEILGFLGPSGAGKTTTIKILTGQLKQSTGEAAIIGRDTTKLNSQIYQQVGIVSDQSGIYEWMTVYENLDFYRNLLGVSKEQVEFLLKRVGLAEHRNKKAGKLSKGQTQRLILARAVIHQPKVLFLDEPTSGLDPTTALSIHRLLLEFRDNGMAIFLTTHNMEEATKLCDKVALLNEGHIVEFGTPKEICLRYNTLKQYQVLLEDEEEVMVSHDAKGALYLHDLIVNNQVVTIHSCEPTLEKVFITVTGRGLV